MYPDVKKFYQATIPSKTLSVDTSEEDQQYYVDFSPVRGIQVVEDLLNNITFVPNLPTCQLFTGHIGCGKSTELLQLKSKLEAEGFFVVYFQSNDSIELADLDITDILLAIAAQVSKKLDRFFQDRQTTIEQNIELVRNLLQTEIELSARAQILGLGEIAVNTAGEFYFDVGIPGIGQIKLDKEQGLSFVAPLIGEITAQAKASPEFRQKIRGYLESRTRSIIEAINHELIEPGIKQLKERGKKGLVVIVDDLEKILNIPKEGQPQDKYLFVERGDQLKSLNCHLVYTIPLALSFSNDSAILAEKFDAYPMVFPMIPIKTCNGSKNQEAINLLKRMVLARAFPNLKPSERVQRIAEIFDPPEMLNYLCDMSGGHVRQLLRFVNSAISKERNLPLSEKSIKQVISIERNSRLLAITDDEWKLLRKVNQNKRISGDEEYDILIRSLFVFQYRNDDEPWFALNPLLADARQLKDSFEQSLNN